MPPPLAMVSVPPVKLNVPVVTSKFRRRNRAAGEIERAVGVELQRIADDEAAAVGDVERSGAARRGGVTAEKERVGHGPLRADVGDRRRTGGAGSEAEIGVASRDDLAAGLNIQRGVAACGAGAAERNVSGGGKHSAVLDRCRAGRPDLVADRGILCGPRRAGAVDRQDAYAARRGCRSRRVRK